MKKIVLSILGFSLLSGCGGSGNSSLGGVSFTTSPVRVFSDGAGVGSVSYAANGERGSGYVITPELYAVLQELENVSEIPDVDGDVPIVGTGPNTIIREGAANFDGFTVNVLVVSTEEEDVLVTLVEEPSLGISFLVTEGPATTGIPTSGTATYTGTMGVGPRLDPSALELGAFEASIDFGDAVPVVAFDGSSSSYSIIGSATVTGDSFSSSSITIGTPTGDVSASLRGDFHDSGAEDMAGVIYSNDSLGTYAGAFVGSK